MMNLTDQQINEMVNRFLGWRLPDNFNPDGGISYQKLEGNWPGPSGTNLLDANQAEQMIRYITNTTNSDRPSAELTKR